MLSRFCHVWLCVTLWTVACQAPLSLGFFRQEYWSELPFPSPGVLPDPGINPMSPVSSALQVNSLPAEPSGKPLLLLSLCAREFCARELGQGPVGLAHFCCPFSVAPSFSTICSRVASAGIISLTDLALSRAPPFSGVDSRFLSLFFLWPLHVVPSGRWLEFSCESSRIPNKYKQKWLVLKAQARNCRRVTFATFYWL